MRTHASPSRSAFTLLEVLLSVTILASMSLLIASLWGQSAAWGDDNAAEHRRMRLQRVLALVRDQWSTRTAIVEMDDFGRTVETTHQSIAFTTTTPILHTDVAIVEATYTIERDLDARGVGPFGAWKLVYRELRLANPTARPDDQADRQANARSIDLLNRCSGLVFERFGREELLSLTNDDDEDDKDEDARASRRDAALGGDGDDEEDDDKAEDPAEQMRWRSYGEGDAGMIPAVRLVGEQEGERFSCLFIVGPLR